jgi:hypothetical protein
VDLDHSYSKGITKATMASKVTVAIMWSEITDVSQQWPRFLLFKQRIPTMAWPHCWNRVFQQRKRFSLLRNNEFQEWPRLPLFQQRVLITTPSHVGCLVPRKNATHRNKHGRTYKVIFALSRQRRKMFKYRNIFDRKCTASVDPSVVWFRSTQFL